jgi:hypothetical protein
MTTTIGSRSEWTAAPLRPVAHWVTVCDTDGRARLEMSWSVPTVEMPEVAGDATGTSTAA